MLVVMVGIPGSGKTTWAEANFRHIVSPDRIRLEEFGTVFETGPRGGRPRAEHGPSRPVPRAAFDEIAGSFQPPSVQVGFHAVLVVTEPTV